MLISCQSFVYSNARGGLPSYAKAPDGTVYRTPPAGGLNNPEIMLLLWLRHSGFSG